MQLVSNMYQSTQNYCQAIPKNTGQQMLIAASATFVMETILCGNPRQGLFVGVCSALATAIYGCVTPLFKQMVSPRTRLSWTEEMGRTFIPIIVTASIIAVFSESSTLKNLPMYAVIYALVIYNNQTRRNVNSANWVCIFPILPGLSIKNI